MVGEPAVPVALRDPSDNPDTADLVFVALLNEGSGTVNDLADGLTASVGAGWEWEEGETGCRALQGDGTQASTYFAPASVSRGDFTVLVIGESDGVPRALFQQDTDVNGDGIGAIGWGIYVGTAGAGINFGDGSGDYPITTDGLTTRRVLVARRSGTEWTLWKDGVLVDTETVPSGSIRHNPNGHRYQVGYIDGSSPPSAPPTPFPLDGAVEFAAKWDRVLDSTAIARISADPYALFTHDYPHNFTVTAGTQQVVLTWDAYSGATNYKIYRWRMGAAPDTTTVYATVGAVTTYTDTCLTPGVGYVYTIKAILPCGDTGIVPSPYRVGSANALAAPATLTATARERAVDLAWSAVSPVDRAITGYHVYRGTAHIRREVQAGTGQGFVVPPILEVADATLIATTTALTYADETAENGVTYYYYVAAYTVCGDGTGSPEANATPQCCLGEFSGASAVVDTSVAGASVVDASVSGAACATEYTAGATVTDTSVAGAACSTEWSTNTCP